MTMDYQRGCARIRPLRHKPPCAWTMCRPHSMPIFQPGCARIRPLRHKPPCDLIRPHLDLVVIMLRHRGCWTMHQPRQARLKLPMIRCSAVLICQRGCAKVRATSQPHRNRSHHLNHRTGYEHWVERNPRPPQMINRKQSAVQILPCRLLLPAHQNALRRSRCCASW